MGSGTKACSLIRPAPHYRAEAFARGLQAAGYRLTDASRCDVLVCWNRYGAYHDAATKVEARGGTVLVVENPYLGKGPEPWYAISRSQHNGAGTWPEGGPERWGSLGIELAPWREGREIIVLPQRGIGPLGIAMPAHWTREVMGRIKTRRSVRIREHPGTNKVKPLEDDLRDAHAVVTWGSGAAIKALAMGVPVFHDFPQWIGAGASLPFRGADLEHPFKGDRLPMFRRLAWAMWRLSEIESGEAFRALCG